MRKPTFIGKLLIFWGCLWAASAIPMDWSCSRLLQEVVQLEEETWPEGTRAPQILFENRLATFPQGFIYVRNDGGKLVGLSTSIRIQLSEPGEIQTWNGATSSGTIANHTPDGNVLYIVSVGVSPENQGRGIGKSLVEQQVTLARNLGIKTVLLGSRVPGFHQYQGDIESYLSQRTDEGRSIDPEIRFYEGSGFSVYEIRPDYMTDDWQSRNYGVLMKLDL